jgi:hypothetical protein
MSRLRIQRAGLSILALVMLGGVDAHAQADLNCDDFATQFDAQMSLNSTYPDDPNRLDADGDWIACENYFGLSAADEARVIPADRVSGAAPPTPTPVSEPTRTPVVDEPASPQAPVPTTASVSTRIDPPADLMAQVEACEVVTVSSRSIAAAGCPGVGSIVLRPPAGTPRMRSQVIIRPGAALRFANERSATAAQVARPDEPGRKRARHERERPRKKRQRAERAAPQVQREPGE